MILGDLASVGCETCRGGSESYPTQSHGVDDCELSQGDFEAESGILKVGGTDRDL